MNRLPHLTEPAHLTDEQMYCLLEDSSSASASTRLHLDTCAACQSEFATLRESLSNLRAAATGYAAAQTPALARRASVGSSRASWLPRPVWVASFATAVLALGVSLSLGRPHPGNRVAKAPLVAVSPIAQPEVSDEALLDGIQRDLSTSVPPSLEPLEVSSSTSAGNLPN